MAFFFFFSFAAKIILLQNICDAILTRFVQCIIRTYIINKKSYKSHVDKDQPKTTTPNSSITAIQSSFRAFLIAASHQLQRPKNQRLRRKPSKQETNTKHINGSLNAHINVKDQRKPRSRPRPRQGKTRPETTNLDQEDLDQDQRNKRPRPKANVNTYRTQSLPQHSHQHQISKTQEQIEITTMSLATTVGGIPLSCCLYNASGLCIYVS
jgi:hypothetical protein